LRLKPILACKSFDASELAFIGSYKSAAERNGVRGDKKIATSDGTSLTLKASPDDPIGNICRGLERYNFKSSKD